MKRVVVTGMGIVSPIGNSAQEVLASLREAKSGIVKADDYAELGFRCQVHGAPKLDWREMLDRKVRRFMGAGAAWNYHAMEQAIRDADLEKDDISNERTGLIMGSGGPSTRAIVQAADTTREKGPKKVGPFEVPKAMCSTNSATLATPYHIKGVSYSISSACSTSAHCIGNGAELIQLGKQDIVFAGGGEELDWTLSVLFDAMNAMSSDFNDQPEHASRPYDAARDGFVIAGGAGVVAVRCMRMAMQNGNGEIDYINPHATSTPIGDVKEIEAIREVFGNKCPPISATKALTGHSLGAAGVHEAIYSLLMMNNGFICESANIETIDPAVADMPIARKRQDNVAINTVMSNSFGFGGTNATLVFRRVDG